MSQPSSRTLASITWSVALASLVACSDTGVSSRVVRGLDAPDQVGEGNGGTFVQPSAGPVAAPAPARAQVEEDAGDAGGPCGERRPASAVSTDAQIVGVLLAADAWQLSLATLTSNLATRADVRAHADRLSAASADALRRHGALAEQKGIGPADSRAKREVEAEAARQVGRLASLAGSAIDAGYAEVQVGLLARLLEVLDQEMLPVTRDQEVQDVLLLARRDVARNLAEARRLAASVRSATP